MKSMVWMLISLTMILTLSENHAPQAQKTGVLYLQYQ